MNTPILKDLEILLEEKGLDKYSVPIQDTDMTKPLPKVKELTISDVCMWLYEKYNIWINVSPVFEFNDGREDYLTLVGHQYYITVITDNKYNQEKTHADRGCVNSPTEAYLSAIEYVLNNIIK